MNGSGPAVAYVVHELHLAPDRCILVHDEVDLDVGRVRGRVAGGAGAHRGVRSVLAAFEDFRFARVKIGIGRPPAGRSLEEHVLQRFDADEQATVDRAIEAGADQALLQLNELAARVPTPSTVQEHAITA
jgi:PTH1 family peptidyl-tRNA hydrolase